jgi:hypothetical protein
VISADWEQRCQPGHPSKVLWSLRFTSTPNIVSGGMTQFVLKALAQLLAVTTPTLFLVSSSPQLLFACCCAGHLVGIGCWIFVSVAHQARLLLCSSLAVAAFCSFDLELVGSFCKYAQTEAALCLRLSSSLADKDDVLYALRS